MAFGVAHGNDPQPPSRSEDFLPAGNSGVGTLEGKEREDLASIAKNKIQYK